ncbi:hypothetical protein [Sphingobacterium multivorum]|uniref:hypothetical protein n=1 Tax=Sphingobacterium multivorum TaxID=28454 RepID=UPI0031BB1C18
MKNFEDVRNEYFIELGFKNPESAIFDMSIGCSKLESAIKIERHYTEIGKRFAIEVAKEALRNAAENATMKYHCGHFKTDTPTKHHQQGADNIQIDKRSILSESNIPKL